MSSSIEYSNYPFPHDLESLGYRIFPLELENDPNIFFHGTALENLEQIISEGFKANPHLESVSYATTSAGALSHAAQHSNGIIIADRFDDLNAPGLKVEISIAHTFIPPTTGLREEPIIVGVCELPKGYKHW